MISKSYLAIVASVTILSIASARVARDVPKDDISFTQFFENASKDLESLQNNLLKLFGVDSTEQLKQNAVEQGKQFTNKLDEWAKTIKIEAESLKDSDTVKDLRSTVDKAIEEFKLKHPETATDIKVYVDKANKTTEEIVSKLKAISESDDAKNVKDAAQKLIDSAAESLQNIVKEAQEAAKNQ